MTQSKWPVLQVPAREIPVPSSISPGAQEALANGFFPARPYPAMDDQRAWIERRETTDAFLLARLESEIEGIEVDVREDVIDGAHIYAVTPARAHGRRVYLDIHGGGLTIGGGLCCRAMAVRNAVLHGTEVWAVDYGMPPEHPYPAGLDDCVAAYRALLRDHTPAEIVIGGVSAGSNLAAATILRARDEGLPLPAACLLISPELDLTESGDSFLTNLGVDTILAASLMPANLLYAAGHDLADPYLSPLFGDFSKGFPPTWITSGTRDLFLSNAARMHRALRQADLVAELHIFEATPHGLALGVGTPEQADFNRELRSFLERHWA